MTTEAKLEYVTFQMQWHEREAEKHIVDASAFRLLKEELERTLTCDAILHETESVVRQSLHAAEGMRQ